MKCREMRVGAGDVVEFLVVESRAWTTGTMVYGSADQAGVAWATVMWSRLRAGDWELQLSRDRGPW